jgi:hypothetical protein
MERFNFGHICLVSWRVPVLEWACFLKFGQFYTIILLSMLCIPLACTFSPSSMPMIFRFNLLLELQHSCMFLSQFLSCLIKISSVFHIYLLCLWALKFFHLFQSQLLHWFKGLFFPGFLFDFFLQTFHIFVILHFHILYCPYFMYFFILYSL